MPEWAPGLGGGVVVVDGGCYVETPAGRAGIVFAPRNDYGILDHHVTMSSGGGLLHPLGVRRRAGNRDRFYPTQNPRHEQRGVRARRRPRRGRPRPSETDPGARRGVETRATVCLLTRSVKRDAGRCWNDGTTGPTQRPSRGVASEACGPETVIPSGVMWRCRMRAGGNRPAGSFGFRTPMGPKFLPFRRARPAARDRQFERGATELGLCEGIVCCYCRAGAIHRPTSNRYDEATGRILHIAYFGWMAPCRGCSRRLRAEQGDAIGIRLPAPGSMMSSTHLTPSCCLLRQ